MQKASSALLLAAVVALAISGAAIAYAVISISGSSGASATTMPPPTMATFGGVQIGILSSPEVVGNCTAGSGLSIFSCTGTSLTAGNSYTLSATVTNPTSATEPVTITFGNTSWTSTCAMN